MDRKLVLPKICEHCSSENIKQSFHYREYYFCRDCKDGGKMLDDKKVKDEELLKEFEKMLEDNC